MSAVLCAGHRCPGIEFERAARALLVVHACALRRLCNLAGWEAQAHHPHPPPPYIFDVHAAAAQVRYHNPHQPHSHPLLTSLLPTSASRWRRICAPICTRSLLHARGVSDLCALLPHRYSEQFRHAGAAPRCRWPRVRRPEAGGSGRVDTAQSGPVRRRGVRREEGGRSWGVSPHIY